MPLKTILHGELWDKNILLHEKALPSAPKRSTKKGADTRPDVTKLSNGSCRIEDETQLKMIQDTSDTKDLLAKLPISVMLSDWKFTCIGSPTLDLATLILTTTPSQQFRADHTKDLLKKYFQIFTDVLKDRYQIPVAEKYPEFTFESFQKDYDNSLYGALLTVRSISTNSRFKTLPRVHVIATQFY